MSKLVHCVVALDAEGRTINTVAIHVKGQRVEWTDCWEAACDCCQWWTNKLVRNGGKLLVGRAALGNTANRMAAGFEVISEPIIEED